MKNLPWRGLAVLILLCAAYRASALTVKHEFSTSGSEVSIMPGALAHTVLVHLPKFDPTLGELVSVTITTNATGRAIGSEHNPYDTPQLAGGFIILNTRFTIGPIGYGVISPDQQYQKGPNDPSYIPAYGTVSTTFDFNFNFTDTTTSDLNRFVGPGALGLGIGISMRSGSDSVGSSLSYLANTTVTYSYRIPDSGAAAILWVPLLLMMVVRHRRSLRGEELPRGA